MNYPVHLNLSGKTCIVIGGGKIAERKVAGLLLADARVIVVSPTVTNNIKKWQTEGELVIKEKSYEAMDIKDAFLIVAATNERNVNDLVFRNKRDDQLINIVDDQKNSDFFVPAVIRRGKLLISISTSGASPGFAKKIKEELEKNYDEMYEEYIIFLEKSRRLIRENVNSITCREKLNKQLLCDEMLELSRQKKYEERQKCVDTLLKKANEKDE